MRAFWTEPELRDLKRYPDWETFHNRHPNRTYDSWEVKRRRISGGTGGTRLSAALAERKAVARLLSGILTLMETYLNER